MPPHPYDDPAAPSSAPETPPGTDRLHSTFTVDPTDRPYGAGQPQAYDPYPPRNTWMRPIGFGAVALLAAVGLWLAYAKTKDPALAAQPGATVPLIRAEQGATKIKATAQNQTATDQDNDVYNINKTQPKVEKLLPPPEQPMQKPTAPPVQVAASTAPGTSQNPTQNPPTTPVLPGSSATPTPLEPQILGDKPFPKSVPIAPPGPSQQPAAATGTLATPDAPSKMVAVPPPGVGGGSQGGIGKVIQVGPPGQVPVALSTKAGPKQQPTSQTSVTSAPSPTVSPVTPSGAAIVSGAGGLKIQIAATKDEPGAKKEFERLQRTHPDLLGGLSLTVVRVDLGEKGIFYRIQAGPMPDKVKADKLCNDLKAVSIGCIVVK